MTPRKIKVLNSLQSSLVEVKGIIDRDHYILSSEIRGPVHNLQEYLNRLVEAEQFLEKTLKDVQENME
jgi:hypothetical protein